MKLLKKKTSFFILILGVLTLILTTGCSKKTTKQKTSSFPSAASLINSNFNKSIQSGYYTQTLSSKEMNQTTKASGKFKQNAVTYMDYSITSNSKTQTEKIWLTNSTLYLLLQGNHGNWIKNSADGDNFDSNQVTNRFSNDTFSTINKEFIKHAQVKKSGTSSYRVSYSGTNAKIWNALNVLVVDTMNSPGSQNMNIARTVNAADIQNIKIDYIINKSTKKISNITYQAIFSINDKYNFTWKQVYNELNEHNDLKVPKKIQKNAIDVKEIKKQQANN